MENKKVIELDRYENGIILNALNEFRTKLINENISTDSVDELLMKVMDTPYKKRSLSLGKAKGNRYFEAR